MKNYSKHQQLVNLYCVVDPTICMNVLPRIYRILCGPLEVSGGPPVVHLDHVENHWVIWKTWKTVFAACQPFARRQCVGARKQFMRYCYHWLANSAAFIV